MFDVNGADGQLVRTTLAAGLLQAEVSANGHTHQLAIESTVAVEVVVAYENAAVLQWLMPNDVTDNLRFEVVVVAAASGLDCWDDVDLALAVAGCDRDDGVVAGTVAAGRSDQWATVAGT